MGIQLEAPCLTNNMPDMSAQNHDRYDYHLGILLTPSDTTEQAMVVPSDGHKVGSLLEFDPRNELIRNSIYTSQKKCLLNRWQSLKWVGVFRFVISFLHHRSRTAFYFLLVHRYLQWESLRSDRFSMSAPMHSKSLNKCVRRK